MMLRQACFITAFLSILSSFSQSRVLLNEQLKKIGDEHNDSIAFIQLKDILTEYELSDKEILNVNFKIMNRAVLMRKFKIALETANDNASFAEKKGLDSACATFTKYLGIINYSIHRKKESIPYFEKAMSIAQANKLWELEASCYNNIGGVLTDFGEYEKAEKYLLRSIKIMTDNGKPFEQATLRSYRILASLYSFNNEPEKAESMFQAFIEKCKEKKDTALLCDNLLYYSALLVKRGDYKKAIVMSGEALAYRRKLTNLNDLSGVITIHARNLRAAGKLEEAFDLIEESKGLLLEIFAKDLEKEISEVEVKYKTAQLKQEKELAELKTKKQQQIYLFSFIGLFILAGSGIYFRNQRKNAKHLTELSEIEKLRFKDVIEAEEKERSRIAQELHDGLGQLLSAARLNVAVLEDTVSDEDKEGVERSLKIIDDACVEVRSISHNMMPSALIRLGLIPAVNELVNNVNSAKGIKIDFTSNVDSSLGKSLDITIYRVVQEILNNMIRHAKANHIHMAIEKNGDDLKISMKDNGIGFDTEELKNSKGIGWKNIFSRISMLDGSIKLESEPQKGTEVYINLKLRNG